MSPICYGFRSRAVPTCHRERGKLRQKVCATSLLAGVLMLAVVTGCAFVVQFRARPPEASLSWEGRVEHLVSGQVVRFHSPEELLAFLTRMLTAGQEPSRTG